jgi:hypothetical protein
MIDRSPGLRRRLRFFYVAGFTGFKVIEKQLEPAGVGRYYNKLAWQSLRKIRSDGICKHIQPISWKISLL